MKKPNLRNMKRLAIWAEHAVVEELSQRQKERLGFSTGKKVIRRSARKEKNILYSAGMALCNVLYPKEFPRQTASGIRLRKKSTFSEKKELTEKSQEAINDFYESQKKTGWGVLSKKYIAHRRSIGNRSENRIAKIRLESGIIINPTEVNIGVEKKGKNFVFFEPTGIEIEKMESFIKKMPDGLRKRQAQELLKALKKFSPEGIRQVYFH